jgi:hypothetical protein
MNIVIWEELLTGGGGADEDVPSRIKKANVAFVQLYRIWKNKNIRIKTKLNIFNSNVKAVLLYGCETWKVTNSITQKLQSFINRCLRRILNVRWPDVISNIMLWEKKKTKLRDLSPQANYTTERPPLSAK